MSPLIPEFRRLVAWAKDAPKAAPQRPIPPGFASRVAARWCATSSPNLLMVWQEAIWASAWAAAAIIVLGLVLLNSERLGTTSAYDVSPAYQVVSTDLIP